MGWKDTSGWRFRDSVFCLVPPLPQTCFVQVIIVGSNFLFNKSQKLVQMTSVALTSLENLKGTHYKDMDTL